MSISDFYCTNCGKYTLSLPRKNGRTRKGGHLKKLYCPNCKEEHNCAEVDDNMFYTLDDFKLEFSNNNFVNGERIFALNQIKYMDAFYTEEQKKEMYIKYDKR